MNEALPAFLYLLMRDHLPAGKVESVMGEIRFLRRDNKQPVYSAPHLEAYARELAHELLETP